MNPKQFKFSYSPLAGATSRSMIIDADSEYEAKKTFWDLVSPNATIWSIAQLPMQRVETSRESIAEIPREYQSSSWNQPVPIAPVAPTPSILPLVAAATAGYVVGRASIPPVVVAPVRDWDQEQRDREDQRDWDANADFRQYQREQQRERDQRDYDREMVAYRKLQLDPIYQMAQAEISRKWKIECAERQAKEAIVVVYTAEEIAVRQRQQIELDKQYRELNGFPPAYNGFLDYCWAKIQALGIILLVGFGLFGFILLGLKFANLLR
jgi:hypothetical protein